MSTVLATVARVMRHQPGDRRRKVASRSPEWVLGCTVLLFAALTPAVGAGPPSSAADQVEPKVEPRYEEPLTEYRALRRMHAKSDRFNHEAWLEAWTQLDASGFRYEIVSECGSDYIRNKVLKAVLKREQEVIAEGGERAALTDANYDFTETEQLNEDVRYVLMKPKRKDVLLVDGRMVLSRDGSDLLRIEGRLARNPSFWTSLVNVIRHFAKVDGVSVPVSTESVAKLKLAGQSTLDIVYEYESINGRPVTVAARQILASAAAAQPR